VQIWETNIKLSTNFFFHYARGISYELDCWTNNNLFEQRKKIENDVDNCVTYCFRYRFLFHLWQYEVDARRSFPGRFDSIASKYLELVTRHRHTTSSWRYANDDVRKVSPSRDEPLVHASSSKYRTTGKTLIACGINFLLFLALARLVYYNKKANNEVARIPVGRSKSADGNWIFQANPVTTRSWS